MRQSEFTFDRMKDHPEFQDLAPHIVKRFWKYHQDNPHIFGLFRKFSEDVFRAGKRRYGVQALSERIRWHIQVETKGDDFKMNNNHLSCYSRLVMIECPHLSGIFKTRRSPGTMTTDGRDTEGKAT